MKVNAVFQIGVGMALWATGLLAQNYSGYAPFPPVGKRAVAAVWQRLQACQLRRMSPWDPRLPAPLIPAQAAIVAPNGKLLAYFIEDYQNGYFAAFKNPNGGMSHTVGFTNSQIRFLTPYAGVIAHGNTFVTPTGPGVNLYCRSRSTDWPLFHRCIEANWVDAIANQLCRFGSY